MERRNITDAWLRSVRPPATGRLEVRDATQPGLLLRMTPAGVATWSVRTRVERQGQTGAVTQTRAALGTWPAVGIAEARRRALATIAALQGGADPVAERRAGRVAREAEARRVAEAETGTVDARMAEWRGAVHARPWSVRYASEVKRVCLQAVVPMLGARLLRETTREDWAGVLQRRQANGPAAANFLYRTVSSFLGHAEARGWIPGPLLPRKGAQVLAPAVAARERVLTDAELARVWQAAGAEPPKMRAFVRLLILTAAREMEVADLALGEVDRAAGRWALPAERTKNRRPIVLPLDPLALAEIAGVWPDPAPSAGADNGWRLLGKIKGQGFRGFGRLKLRMDARMAEPDAEDAAPRPLPGWRWHDLRRTARTGMTRLGMPREHAEAAINHVSGRTALERTYDRHDYAAEVLTALGTWQAHVAGLVAVAAGSTDAQSSGAGGKA